MILASIGQLWSDFYRVTLKNIGSSNNEIYSIHIIAPMLFS